MTDFCNHQRRRLVLGLAAAPLLLYGGKARPSARPWTMTLTGQALIAHDFCREGYPGLTDALTRNGIIAASYGDTGISERESA